MKRRALAVLLAVLIGLPAQGSPSGPTKPRRADYDRAKRNARAWLDRLEVDPVDLLRHGIKGKKKLAEILDSYLGLLDHASGPDEKEAIRKRVEELARHASRPEYHDMPALSAVQFRENSMSYLRVAWLLERFGLDTTLYRREILKTKTRLDEHLRERGPWQRAMFLEYYERLGLEKPPHLPAAPLAEGVIARRVPAARYTDNDTYDLTHEVFVAFDYGARREQTRFSEVDLAHVREVLNALISRYRLRKNPDLVGELASCMTYLGWEADPAFRAGIDYLLDCQNSNGSWGDYEAYRKQFGKYLEHHVYLHTTMVVLEALMESYEGNRGR